MRSLLIRIVYSTCTFCHAPLGANDALEAFPVGRRLAFDAAKGRLWVVCRKCERWNLTPLEERWEAIEQAERLFRDTRLRVSTDNIGLARLRDGTELVRIGEPQRPEMAAWRYGDQFGRRWRRGIALGFVAGIATCGVFIAGPALGIATIGTVPLFNIATSLAQSLRQRRVVARIPVDGEIMMVRAAHVPWTRIASTAEGWALDFPHAPPLAKRALLGRFATVSDPRSRLTGDAALRAAASLLPHANPYGGSRATVQQAVRLLEETPSPHALFARAARSPRPAAMSFRADRDGLISFPPEIRLALEMAAHEDAERRAMEGELAELERTRREAEEIAAIADDLLIPDDVRGRLRSARATPSPSTSE